MGRIIGIDLGTTNSCVAVLEEGAVRIIPNGTGGRTTPSVVAFTAKGERLLGQIARRQSVTNAENTVHGIKRMMGRRYEDPEVQKMQPYLPYRLSAASNGDVRVSVRGRQYSPPEISAMLLEHLRCSAEDYLNEKVTDAVITVPAYFDDSQRQATRDAGRIAGLSVQRIISEPTAAALAYGLDKAEKERVAIYDLGGGTFDVSILEISGGVFEVVATCGDSFLGGEDFDRCIVDWMLEECRRDTGIVLGADVLAMQRLREAAEKAKCELSMAEEARISIPFIAMAGARPVHLDMTLTRDLLEGLVIGLIERTTAFCEKALDDAGLAAEDVGKVILVGGQTRMPAVIRHVGKIFGKPPSIEVNPDEVVAAGAALQGAVLDGSLKDIVLLDVLPLSLGLETQGGLFTRIIEHNAAFPVRKTMTFTTVADNQAIVDIHVLQGEREMAGSNRSLGKFELVGIAPAPGGVPQIDVTFDMDANGILSVSAADKLSGKKQQVRITPSTGLSREEIARFVEDARQHAEQDRMKREQAELANRIRAQASAAARSYAEFGRFLDSDEQEMVKKSIQQARDVAPDEDRISLLKDVLDQLEAGSRTLSAALFRAPAGDTPAPGDRAGESGETDVRRLMKSALDEIKS